MIGETYELLDLIEGERFVFVSTGAAGTVVKIVLYEEIKGKPNRFNLGFGDLIGEKIVDDVISNNNDLIKVMNTVAATVYRFFEHHPKAVIEFKGVDEKRSRLYHTILKRRKEEIEKLFILKCFDGEKWEDFDTQKTYAIFEIKNK